MNSKSLICHKLTSYKPLHPQELRSIFISRAARYAALSLKSPRQTKEERGRPPEG
ncbi:Uncharacterized protein FKW44_001122 [Caligus rogercresseyi]|uniref:Uncharacterized protein n=1 Tax=Caligus rogercresseyi TaxID=217165 RepID=A0A7T8QVB8_CALRO|nr:Uncharacterized protein FKW44_001122 [Caligus rogercresseyi]